MNQYPRTKNFLRIICIVVALYAILVFVFIKPRIVYVGSFAGECGKGNCKTNYEISADYLKIDDTSDDTISNIHRVIKGNFDSLQLSIPAALLFHSGKFGCPDCNDSGGYILGFKILGAHFNYEIEKGHEPWYFHDMTNILTDRITKIQAIEKNYK